MKRAREVRAAGHWDDGSAVDSITLDAHDRYRRRVVLSGERGTKFLLDLPQATALHDGDGLVLDDGTLTQEQITATSFAAWPMSSGAWKATSGSSTTSAP